MRGKKAVCYSLGKMSSIQPDRPVSQRQRLGGHRKVHFMWNLNG